MMDTYSHKDEAFYKFKPEGNACLTDSNTAMSKLIDKEDDGIFEDILSRVRETISLSPEVSDEAVYEVIKDATFAEERLNFAEVAVRKNLIQNVFYTIRGEFGILQPLLEDKTISEIMINGTDNIFVERNGKIEKSPLRFNGISDLEEIIRRMISKVRREINELNPITDARLEDGSRVNAVYKNIAIDGPVLTIRKFPDKPLEMADLIRLGTITEEAAEYLRILVECGYNIFISGGTSSGKTTFLNVLSNYIPKEERVITIEDSAELQIKGIANLVRMECRNANVQGKGKIGMQELIKSSLRMRPDRIVVGEVRGAEVLDMIQAMNTGHDGSLSTGHGNSVEGIIKRLEAMFLQAANFPIQAIRSQIAEGIDLIVQMGRLPNKKRTILDIAEIYQNINEDDIKINRIFKYESGKGLVRTGNILKNKGKLILKGQSIEALHTSN